MSRGAIKQVSLPLGSISPSFYDKLLHTQIPKAQKDSQIKQLFELLGPACVKAARKHVDEIDPCWGLPSIFGHLTLPDFKHATFNLAEISRFLQFQSSVSFDAKNCLKKETVFDI